jgi:hypothetical protein
MGEGNVRPLEAASPSKVDTALAALVDVLNAVSAHYPDGQKNLFDGFEENAYSVLELIDDGLRAKKERLERLLREGYREEDFRRDF